MNFFRPRCICLFGFTVFVSMAGSATAATFNVTSTDDSGPGTLRQAILDANAGPGADRIEFDIPGAGAHTIQPVTALPAVEDPVEIDALTQSDADCSSWPATLRVVLEGSQAPSGANGLALSAGESTVSGLVVNGFDAAGILIDSDNNALECNFIGTDSTGTTGGFTLENDIGVEINGGNDNMIGGAVISARNLISNNDDGMLLKGGATGNTVAGNFIGTDATGMVVLENDAGVVFEDAPDNTVGGADHDAGVCNKSCNLISGNDFWPGIDVDDAGANNLVIQGNFIGTDINGAAAIPNGDSGIEIGEAASDILIGGLSDPGVCSKACNLISGNDDHGILADDSGSEGIVIEGNFIGTDASGMSALANGRSGIDIDGLTTIGSVTPGRGNLISGNEGAGIEYSADGGTIRGNLIGVAIDGSTPLGNGQGGIGISGNDNRIGGTGPGEGNVIAFNGSAGSPSGQGLVVFAGTPVNIGNTILGNSIHANSGLGIDLAGDGVSGNDGGDNDDGPNNLQNFPVLNDTPTLTGAGATTVVGSLDSTPSTDFRLEFFASENCDPAHFGEGQTFIGTTNVTTDGDGLATFSENFSTGAVPAGWFVTATGTRLDNSGNPVETSEFSQCDVLPGDSVVTTTADSGPGSLREAIKFANANTGPDLIEFNIDAASDPGCDAGTGVCTLQLASALPPSNSDTTLDGTTQPGASCEAWPPALKIVIPSPRLLITGDNSAIRGLVLFAFDLVADNSEVTCNFIGTDATGSVVSLTGGGLIVGGVAGGSGNTIGGTAATDRNLISGNNTWGLELRSADNVVQGNFIGTDVTGQSALPNRLSGIRVSPDSSSRVGTNLIGSGAGTTPGGPCSGACNLISGNDREGISLENTVGAAVSNIIEGNFIGTAVDGAGALGNATDGVRIHADGNTIGGLEPEGQNLIAHNGESGVSVVSGGFADVAGTGNWIAGNAIFSNGGLGIDLEADGATGNDPGDADEGANNLQNFPEIASVTGDSAMTLSINYSVPSATANSAYPLTIEFFLADADGEEGQTIIGTDAYLAGEAGQSATAVLTPDSAIADGDLIVATATDAEGNTSEFSAPVPASGGADPETIFADGFEE